MNDAIISRVRNFIEEFYSDECVAVYFYDGVVGMEMSSDFDEDDAKGLLARALEKTDPNTWTITRDRDPDENDDYILYYFKVV